jgi:hypothetical protein
MESALDLKDLTMNNFPKPIVLSFVLIIVASLMAQTSFAQQSMASSVGLHVYPGNNQSAETQSKDDYECFNWAKTETGHDPMNPQQVVVQAAPTQSGPDGSAVRGATRGAVIGEVTNNDAGKGAAYGAAVGAIRGKRSRKAQAQQAEQQAAAQGQKIEQQRHEDFKNAMKACMSGRGYSVT